MQTIEDFWNKPLPIVECAHPTNGRKMKVTKSVYDANPKDYTLYKVTPEPVAAGAVTMKVQPVKKRTKRRTQKQISGKRK